MQWGLSPGSLHTAWGYLSVGICAFISGMLFSIRSLFSAPRVRILENREQFLFILASFWSSKSMKWPSVVCWMFSASSVDPCKGHSRWWHRAKGCPCSLPRPRALAWAHFLFSYPLSLLWNTFWSLHRSLHQQRHPPASIRTKLPPTKTGWGAFKTIKSLKIHKASYSVFSNSVFISMETEMAAQSLLQGCNYSCSSPWQPQCACQLQPLRRTAVI